MLIRDMISLDPDHNQCSIAPCKGYQQITSKQGRVVQSVKCLATDVSLTADTGVASLIPAWSHTFVEIDHEMISRVILLSSPESFKKSCCQLQGKVFA